MENVTSSPLTSKTLTATEEPLAEDSDAITFPLQVFSMIIYSSAFLVGTVGNGLVIWVAGFRMTRTVTTILFLNLAVADFIFCLFLPISVTQVALDFHWPFGWLGCKFFTTLAVFNLFASVFLLTLISIDRCVSILRPIWARNHRTPRRAALGAGGIWLLALVLCIPTLLYRDTEMYENGYVSCFLNFDPWNETAEDPELFTVTEAQRYKAQVAIRFVFGFAIPLVVICSCYGLIAARLQDRQAMRSRRPFRVLAAVVAAFFFCWLPFHIVSFMELVVILNQLEDLGTWVILLGSLSTSLAYVNSCLNPILYVFMGRDFRERLLRSLPASLERALAEESADSDFKGSNFVSTPQDTESQEV
ncbi:N-formyl peptide receptor 2-like [Ornithorhynchus anatinus]|uniref:N-formyl peptide receptor 2-like n=1 Tax=Ornithorhynchus anatinus TaxID=9258 RepID=UPI0001554D1B|nr:N-formyl peptide receptor 2-like [Ornithorhynchus anatinus]